MAFPHKFATKKFPKTEICSGMALRSDSLQPPFALNQSFLPVLIARSGYLLHIFLLAAALSRIKATEGIPSHETFLSEHFP